MDIKKVLPLWFYKFFDKKSKGIGANILKQKKQLAEELQKPIIRTFLKIRVNLSFKDNIWGADLADMLLISKVNKGTRFLLYFINIFSKYAWIVPLKDRKGVTIVNAFQKVLIKSDHKPNKIWVDGGSEFFNSSFKKLLKYNYLEMYSTHNEGKSVVAERFIRTLKNNIYKHMAAVSRDVYIDKIDDIENKHNNTYNRTIKMKPIDVKYNNTYI